MNSFSNSGYGACFQTSGDTYSESSFISTELARTTIVTAGETLHGDRKAYLPWFYSVNRFSYPNGKLEVVYNGGNYTKYSGWLSSAVSGDLIFTDRQPYEDISYESALSDLYEKIRGNLDLSIDAFQARQTGRMFSASDRLLDFARKVPKLKRIGSAWLELRYGWQPLVQDIYGTVDELIRVATNSFTICEGRARTKVSTDLSLPCTLQPSLFQRSRRSRGFQSTRIKCKMQLGSTFDPGRFSSLNPASIAWELLPYSFVVDWFYNVGGALRSLESAIAYDRYFQAGYISRLFIDKVTYSDYGIYDDEAANHTAWSYSESSSASHFVRTVLTELPFPHMPVLHLDLGSGRLLNAAALLSQFLGRR